MSTDAPQKTLRPFLTPLKVGAPAAHEQVVIVPLYGNGQQPVDYVLGSDAIQAGCVQVTEVSEAGSVPELLVTSTAEKLVMLLDGEELVGAKQNRILNTTVAVPPKSKTKIPVSCVEAGRWRHAGRAFRSGGYSSSSLRALQSSSVTRSLREGGEAKSDQGKVWGQVHAMLFSMNVSSPTAAYHDAIDQHSKSIAAYTDKLRYPSGSRGMLIAIGGKFAALDLFDKPATLERVWTRLISGYVLDALISPAGAAGEFAAREAETVLNRVGQAPCQPCPSAGVGEDWRFETDELVGQALVVEGACVHLSAFPGICHSQQT